MSALTDPKSVLLESDDDDTEDVTAGSMHAFFDKDQPRWPDNAPGGLGGQWRGDSSIVEGAKKSLKKITPTKAIYRATIPDGEVVAQRGDERMRWDQSIKKFHHEKRSGGDWKSSKTLNKKQAYEQVKSGDWHEAEGETPKAEVTPRAGTFIGNVPDTHQNAQPQADGSLKSAYDAGYTTEKVIDKGKTAEKTEQIKLSDGRQAIKKTFKPWILYQSGETQVRKEVLASEVARTLGIPYDAEGVGQYSVVTTHFPGVDGDEYLKSGGSLDSAIHTESGKKIGILDWLIKMRDRTADGDNWRVTPDGKIMPIDHGEAFGEKEGRTTSPFAKYWIGMGPEGAIDPKITSADIEGLRPKLEALKDSFTQSKKWGDDERKWHADLMSRFDRLEQSVAEVTPRAGNVSETHKNAKPLPASRSAAHDLLDFNASEEHMNQGQSPDVVSAAKKRRDEYASRGPMQKKIADFVEEWTGQDSIDKLNELRKKLKTSHKDVVAEAMDGPAAPKLYRGTKMSPSKFFDLKNGDKLDLRGLSSFSEDDTHIEGFGGTQGSHGTIIELTDAHGLPIEGISNSPYEREWLVPGKIEVTGKSTRPSKVSLNKHTKPLMLHVIHAKWSPTTPSDKSATPIAEPSTP